MKKRSNKIVVHLRATGSCLGQFKALAEELKNDTLNFIIKCERKIVKTKGHKLEIEGTTCNCVYDYYFDIRTTRALAKDKILFNRKTLKQLDIKGVGYEDDPTKF
ncbi:hypothetical protein [Chryseosolibacter indicus]|nr:hypothetical protein [Chryseosolibacter indicus]